MQVMDFFEENWKMDNFVKEVCLKDPWIADIKKMGCVYIYAGSFKLSRVPFCSS